MTSSFTFYAHELARLEDYIVQARAAAMLAGDKHPSISFDVDDDGFVYLHAAGVDSIKL